MTRRIFHVSYPTPKHTENSIRGIRKAKRLGYNAIDIDMQITKDGKVVGTHWSQPMLKDGFRDPLDPFARHVSVSDMNWSRVRRLFVPKGLYRIHKLRVLLAECARLDIEAVIEPKGDPRFETNAIWLQIRAAQRLTHARVSVRSLRNLGGPGAGVRRVEAAQRAGFHAWVI